MLGILARSWARGQKDRRGRSSPLTLPFRLRLTKAHVDPILTTFAVPVHGRLLSCGRLSGPRRMRCGGLLEWLVSLCRKNMFLIR